MDTKAEQGYLVLADVSGFTSYLATTELEHAHDILHDLLDTTIGAMAPTLTRIEVEGDAVFAYTPEARVPRGETLLEVIEHTYATFRDRVQSIKRQTTCECRACRDIPKLDLKFIMHAGEYIAREYAGSFNLLGSDVNLVHRLLKNHVSESTGWHAYVLMTQQALDRLGVQLENVHEGTESYEHLDEIHTYAYDLHPHYEAHCSTKRVFISPAEADAVAAVEIAAAPSTIWSHLNDPQLRMTWSEGAVITPTERVGGRTAVGAGNHCAHGKQSHFETIVDFKPFDYFTIDMQSGKMRCRYTFHLEPVSATIRLSSNIVMLAGPGPRAVQRFFARRYWKSQMQPALEQLKALCEAHDRSTGRPIAPAAEADPLISA